MSIVSLMLGSTLIGVLACSQAYLAPRPAATTSNQRLMLLMSGEAVLTCPLKQTQPDR
jgi:hypothetical protein